MSIPFLQNVKKVFKTHWQLPKNVISYISLSRVVYVAYDWNIHSRGQLNSWYDDLLHRRLISFWGSPHLLLTSKLDATSRGMRSGFVKQVSRATSKLHIYGVVSHTIYTQAYRSGHNEAVLKTVRPKATGVRIPQPAPTSPDFSGLFSTKRKEKH